MNKEKKETLNRLVVASLATYSDYTPTAKELYCIIAERKPVLVTRGFKSFVKIMNSFPDVENIEIRKGEPDRYTLKKTLLESKVR
jgi:hypothetical protein